VLNDEGTVRAMVKTKLTHENRPLNPAAIQRQIQAITVEPLTLTPSKRGSKTQLVTRAKSNDSTTKASMEGS
jgi:hypothetical protein